MRFSSFLSGEVPGYGAVTDAVIRAVPKEFRSVYPDLKSVITAGKLAEAAEAAASGEFLDADTIRFEPVIPNPGKIIGVGMNYLAHIKEMGREPPKYPALFVRFPDSLVGHGQPVIRPAASRQYDFEGELAVIIGRTGRHIRAGDAFDYVAGYACFLDGSIRDYQRHTSQFIAGKNFYHSGAFGPCLVTSDQIPDPSVLSLRTRINDEILQQGKIDDLCFKIEKLIEYVSTVCQLNPGDVIATGTPSGVGAARDPQRWLEPGDTIQVDIDGIGVLENRVIDE
jgi:2-keto-4-pentenoate hydratase/2-oxohepta-3-ene-1,7-dioic acid hydratase in catechol pathway